MHYALLFPDGTRIDLGGEGDQVYSHTAEDGSEHHWSVAVALRLAKKRGEISAISLEVSGISLDTIRRLYPDIDEAYALTTDLSCPLVFIPFEGKDLLIDGWHRLMGAVLRNVEWLPAYFLTQEEADAAHLFTLPPGQTLGEAEAGE